MRPKGHDRYGKYAHSWPFTDRFGTKFVSCWPRLRGACLIEVHLHEKSLGGNVKWPFMTGARLIQVAASAGGTVCIKSDFKDIFLKLATNGQSDKAFLLTSEFFPQRVVCPCPRAIYM